ncbi:MAG: ABC transporter ATP-binding protein [Bacillota bacterium]|jgi:branched-chain amino acid transport system ATP-binding protein|nr:ABC transporter ATP-binding protein [Candidatus Fermentithermobacillaceae bacterium]
MLEIQDLHVSYGAIKAVQGINLKVPDGKIVALIGTNGAGKSTTLRTICGLLRPEAGRILLDGDDITRLPPQDIVKRGISMVPEGRHVFPDLTVYENLMLGAYIRTNQKEVQEELEGVYGLFPRLQERRQQLAGTLSGGEQQMLALGRALMADPKMLLMDEPSLGLAPVLVQEIFALIERIHRQGKTLLLIEQNARAALTVADYAYVLETGRIAMEGTGTELLANDEVRRIYLGEVAD